MYNFLDFETIHALPDVVRIPELSSAIGLSTARTYRLLDEKRIPYIRIDDASKLNALADLPDVFPPHRLVEAFRISHGLAYTWAHLPGFPAVMERDRIIVDKQGLIRWIKRNENYIREYN